MAFPGAFHACLKLHNCGEMMFGNFLTCFFSAWRDTINKVNWILYPSDPRQLENELPQYILAHSLLTGLLIQLRYGSISKMMLMSYKLGERGDVELFMTTVRFGLTLWASAHAVDYVRLGNDLCQFCFGTVHLLQ